MWLFLQPGVLFLWLIMLWHPPLVGGTVTPSSAHFTLEVRNRQLTSKQATLQVAHGDMITLHWLTDETVHLHLHGYDLEIVVNPTAPTTTHFRADQVGRFAVMAHRFGTPSHRSHTETPLAYLEVRPLPVGLRLPPQPDARPFPPSLPPESARLLETLAAVSQEWQPTDIDIRSSVLCFCLTKGPETIRELRQAAQAWFANGLRAFKDRRYEEAIAAFTKTIQLHPRHTQAYLHRGITFANLQRYQEARADFNTAIDLEPQQPGAYYAAAVMSRLLGDVQQAQRDLQVAVKLGYEPARFLLESHATP